MTQVQKDKKVRSFTKSKRPELFKVKDDLYQVKKGISLNTKYDKIRSRVASIDGKYENPAEF